MSSTDSSKKNPEDWIDKLKREYQEYLEDAARNVHLND